MQEVERRINQIRQRIQAQGRQFHDKVQFPGRGDICKTRSLYIQGAALLVVETQSKRDKKKVASALPLLHIVIQL